MRLGREPLGGPSGWGRARSRPACRRPGDAPRRGFSRRIWAISSRLAGLPLASSTTVGSRTHRPYRRVLALGGALPAKKPPPVPRRVTARREDSPAGAAATPCLARAGLFGAAPSPAHSTRAALASSRRRIPSAREPPLDVPARVAQLLVGQRPRVPARGVAVFGNRTFRTSCSSPLYPACVEAGEARRDLGVEHVDTNSVPRLAPQDRDVRRPAWRMSSTAGLTSTLWSRGGVESGERSSTHTSSSAPTHLQPGHKAGGW